MSKVVQIKVFSKVTHEHGLPAYAQPGDAGMDIRANSDLVIRPQETLLIPTGLYVAIPVGYELQVRPRSGMSFKTKLRVANAPGTIDSGYRGEICIIAENTSVDGDDILIKKGDRVAQLVLNEVPVIQWAPVDTEAQLGDSDRGDGGFGSTGST